MLHLSWRFAGGVAVVLMIVGCGGPTGRGANSLKTTGLVTLDGQPLEGATVSFAPKSGSGGGGGITDAGGRFTVVDGLTPGNYDVSVTKMSAPANAAPQTKEEAMKFAAEQAKAGKAAQKAGKSVAADAPKSLIPEKYNSPKTSGLSAEVTSGGKNDFEFKLQK